MAIRTNRDAFNTAVTAADNKREQLVTDLETAKTNLATKRTAYVTAVANLEDTTTVEGEVKTLEALVDSLTGRLAVAYEYKEKQLAPLLPGVEAEAATETASIKATYDAQLATVHAKRKELLQAIAALKPFHDDAQRVQSEVNSFGMYAGKSTERMGIGGMILPSIVQEKAWSNVNLVKDTIAVPAILVERATRGFIDLP